ncbi:cysteine desulfurase family protein [Erysipelothrix urinaevulpis]|uniref:cysteine desulfurase family protein n=1 Tax=Erysipelothrix urinaevulpis TaxID=2683717 RepID=UPI001359FDD9|nr:aminotransferase class V-fold PLP-dependent enzyme [Erysipelothrix urinaevulpis]
MYFDNAANAPLNMKAFKETYQIAQHLYNANSIHQHGTQTKEHLHWCEGEILNFFNTQDRIVHFTKGATHANNMMILGQRRHQGNIIISAYEHSSVLGPIAYLQSKNIEIRICPSGEDGKICLDSFKKLIDDQTFFISICACESELGIQQDIYALGKIAKQINPNLIFHSDITQAVGKITLNLESIDAFSFSGHKFGSMKGIGALIIKKNIRLVPSQFGSSVNPGTAPIELIDNMARCLIDCKTTDIEYINKMNRTIRANLKACSNILINSPIDACPSILNISILNHKSAQTVNLLNRHSISVSSQSACSRQAYSRVIYGMYRSKKRATTSIRISLSDNHCHEKINLLIKQIRRISA